MESTARRPVGVWPELTLVEWQDTYATLHRWLQIVGKTRLALAPMQNHWWHATLYLSAHGLTTSVIPFEQRFFEVEFDFISHVLCVRTSDGLSRSLPLEPLPVAAFYRDYTALLRSLGITVHVTTAPQELPSTPRLDQDEAHASYDPHAAHRCWRALAQADRVLKEFRGRFIGKSSPSHLWWGAFDLACTRFSGRLAPPHPGGMPNLADSVTREAYSHECISAGWWPGSVDGAIREPAFYAYAYPEPAGIAEASIQPSLAYYHPELHEWILPYDAVRTSSDPAETLMQFLQSTYETAADLAAWDRTTLERAAAPGTG